MNDCVCMSTILHYTYMLTYIPAHLCTYLLAYKYNFKHNFRCRAVQIYVHTGMHTNISLRGPEHRADERAEFTGEAACVHLASFLYPARGGSVLKGSSFECTLNRKPEVLRASKLATWDFGWPSLFGVLHLCVFGARCFGALGFE